MVVCRLTRSIGLRVELPGSAVLVRCWASSSHIAWHESSVYTYSVSLATISVCYRKTKCLTTHVRFPPSKFQIWNIARSFCINHAERNVHYVSFMHWAAHWCGSDRGMAFFLPILVQEVVLTIFLGLFSVPSRILKLEDQLKMIKIGRSFIKLMMNQCSLLLPFCEDSSRDRYFEEVWSGYWTTWRECETVSTGISQKVMLRHIVAFFMELEIGPRTRRR